jgi:putative protein-disulfide isomerase
MPHLYYIHDPMCSWCWGFRPVLDLLLTQLPESIGVTRLLGGLAADTTEPMPEALRAQLQNTWREIETRIPSTRFNFNFWTLNTPRRSTYPACRAVIAARGVDPQSEASMITAIQHAYYLQARNPSDDTTLIALASELSLDRARFSELLNHPSTQRRLDSEITQARRMGVEGFPSLVLQVAKGYWPVRVDYQSADPMLQLIEYLAQNGAERQD